MDKAGLSNWASAAVRWHHRPPIVPNTEDIRWFERCANVCPAPDAGLRAVLLGVTADIATMRWPERTSLVAVDWAAPMVASAWPHARRAAREHVIIGNWLAMPIGAGRRDLAVGDGCYTALGSFAEMRKFNAALAELLPRNGELALRCFSRTAEPPDIDAVFDRLLAGRETNLGLVRWLLFMGLQGRSPDGVQLDDLWRLWDSRVGDPKPYAERYGWRASELAAIERYAGQSDCYIYPTVDEMRELAAPAFELVECDIPTYPFGEHFPRLRFVRR